MTYRETARGTGPQGLRALSPCVIDDEIPDGVAPPSDRRPTDVDGRMGGRRVSPTRRPPQLVALPSDQGPAPPESPVDAFYHRHVDAALAALTPAERDCVELTFFAGLTFEQVAAYRELPTRTVELRLRTGLDGMLFYLRSCGDVEGAGDAQPERSTLRAL